MLIDEKLERINELARKEKSEGLTDAEKSEQRKLRNEYLEQFRQAFRQQLRSVKVVDPEGEDVTPGKLKDEQKKQ